MYRSLKILLFIVLLSGIINIASADRGSFAKKRSKTHLNIAILPTLKNSIAFNLKSGLNYKGSSILNHGQVGNVMLNNTVISYKKGNSIYIIPYKQKVLIPSYSPESGYKLIIRP